MADIPQNELSVALLTQWYNMSKELKALKAKESLLRKTIFDLAFKNPKEGTNKFNLADGYVLKGTHNITRDIDVGAYESLIPQFKEKQIRYDDLVRKKLELAKSVYNKLEEEERLLFDQCLLIKPGSPQLEIVLPAKEKAKKETVK